MARSAPSTGIRVRGPTAHWSRLILDDGTIVDDSSNIVDWAHANPH